MKGGDEEQNQAVLVAEIAVIEILGGARMIVFSFVFRKKNCAMSLLHG